MHMAEDITKTFRIHLERAETLTAVHFEAAKRILGQQYPGQALDPLVLATMTVALATNLQTSRNA
jgi:hypothetical protein